jgi:hypothetical protein
VVYARRKAWLAAEAASPLVEPRAVATKHLAATLGHAAKPNGKHPLTMFPGNFIVSLKIFG